MGRVAERANAMGYLERLRLGAPRPLCNVRTERAAPAPWRSTLHRGVLRRATLHRVATGCVALQLPFNVKEIEGFRYRVEDVLRSCTRISIREALSPR